MNDKIDINNKKIKYNDRSQSTKNIFQNAKKKI